MNTECAHEDVVEEGAAMAGAVTLSPDAEALLDRYLAEVRSLGRGLRTVSVQDVIADVREHVFSSLKGTPAPVAEPEMERVLRRVGPAEQWLPLEELPAWRRVSRRLAASPPLPYVAFALLAVGFLLPLDPMCVLIGASFCLARAAIAHEAPGNQWQRWLLYPSLIVTYASVGFFLLFWPFAAIVDRPYDNHGVPPSLDRLIPLSPGQTIPISAGVIAVGIWVAILSLALVARPTIVRISLYPFAERLSRRGLVLIAGAGLLLAAAGALALRA